jgi:hypothetical protein
MVEPSRESALAGTSSPSDAAISTQMVATIRLRTEASPARRTDQHSGNRVNLAPWKLVLRALLFKGTFRVR